MLSLSNSEPVRVWAIEGGCKRRGRVCDQTGCRYYLREENRGQGRREPPPKERVCACGRAFRVARARLVLRASIYCSRECYIRARQGLPPVVRSAESKERETCALDVASRGNHTLQEVADILGVTRQRVLQIETGALKKLLGRMPEGLRASFMATLEG